METEKGIVIRDSTALELPDESTLIKQLAEINRFQHLVHANMIEGQDYGVIPGTGNKPTLLKPGAEKIAKLLGLADEYIIMDRQEDWSKPFFRFMVKCQLISIRSGVVISEGLGECNSMESKYRYRDAQRKCPSCGEPTIFKSKQEGQGWYCWAKKGGCGLQFKADDPEIVNQESGKVENEDIYSLVNTLLKMAKKRALVDASLSAGRLSNVFTQDLDEIRPKEDKPAPVVKQTPKAPPAPSQATTEVKTGAASKEQLIAIEEAVQKHMFKAGEIIKTKGWNVTKPSELTYAQAEELLKEYQEVQKK